jgi:hypothetical protein
VWAQKRHVFGDGDNKIGRFKELEHLLAQLVEAVWYKLEGRGFDSRWCHWNFFIDTTALGSPQPLREISMRNISWGVKAAGA